MYFPISCNIITKKLSQDQYGTRQTIWCFTQFDGYGKSLKIQTASRDLGNYGWDNKISSCQFTGFWLLYEDQDYNKYNPNVNQNPYS